MTIEDVKARTGVDVRPGTQIYEGRPCRHCGETVRYLRGKACVRCAPRVARLNKGLKKPPSHKTCAGCGKVFALTKGATSQTKFCSLRCGETHRHRENPERKQKKDRASYQRHAEKRRAASREWRLANPERMAYHARRHHLLTKFGLTLEDYDRMLADQGGRCAICRTDDPSPWKHLCVDHDHESGRVRGLLCRGCNTAIGQVADDPERLRRAVAYLEAAWDSTG